MVLTVVGRGNLLLGKKLFKPWPEWCKSPNELAHAGVS
jgi:hypothetical protein